MRYLAIAALFCAAALTPGCGGGERIGQRGTQTDATEAEPAPEDGSSDEQPASGGERIGETGYSEGAEIAAPDEAEPYAAEPETSEAEPAPEEEAAPE